MQNMQTLPLLIPQMKLDEVLVHVQKGYVLETPLLSSYIISILIAFTEIFNLEMRRKFIHFWKK